MSRPAAAAFASGAAVLALEFLGTRWLAPVFGATIDVWCAVIATTLGSLTAGYLFGGRWAASAAVTGAWRLLSRLLAVAGAWTLLLPLLRRPVLEALAGMSVGAGALAAAALFLAPALFALGAASPVCLRLHLEEGAGVGRSAGTLWAVSTAGSVFGALSTALWLLPRLPLPNLLSAWGAGLVLLAAAARHASGLRSPWPWAFAVAAAAWAARPGLEVPGRLWTAHSLYGEVAVRDVDSRRMLLIDNIVNTVVDRRTGDSTSDYVYGLELLAFMRPKVSRAVLVGLGAGGIVRILKRDYDVVVDVIEIDPRVDEAARRFFGFEPPGAVMLGDGRRLLKTLDGAGYGALILDAFAGDQHPYHLFSREALAIARGALAPGGVVAINLIGYAYGKHSGLWRAVAATLREQFPHVRAFIASDTLQPRQSYVNILLFASDRPLDFARDPKTARPGPAALFPYMLRNELPVDPALFRDVPILTDAYNPVEELNRYAFRDIRRSIMRTSIDR